MIDVRGDWEITLMEGDEIVDRREHSNLITYVGLKHIASLLTVSADPAMGYIAISTGTGGTKSSTALPATQKAIQTLDGTFPKKDAAPNDNRVTYEATIAAGTGDGEIASAAIFNAASSGDMLNYVEFDPPYDKTTTRSMLVRLKITIGSLG